MSFFLLKKKKILHIKSAFQIIYKMCVIDQAMDDPKI